MSAQIQQWNTEPPSAAVAQACAMPQDIACHELHTPQPM